MGHRFAALAALALCAAASARGEEAPGCAIALARTGPDGVGTYTAECRWPVAPSTVSELVGTPGKMAEVTTALLESTRLADGRVVQVISSGWPIADRQSTLAIEREALPGGGLLLSYSLAPEQVPVAKGRVAARRNDGRWEIRPGAGGTQLRYESAFDAGGDLPPSLVQRAVPERMAQSLAELRAAAEAIERSQRADDGAR